MREYKLLYLQTPEFLSEDLQGIKYLTKEFSQDQGSINKVSERLLSLVTHYQNMMLVSMLHESSGIAW